MSKEYYLKNREKLLAHYKAYREANKELIAERKKADFEKHREKRKEKQKEWRLKNAEKLKADKRAFFQKNKEKIYEARKASAWTGKAKEYSAKYRERNKEKLAQSAKRWVEENREKVRAAKKRHSDSSVQCQIGKKLRVRIRGVLRRAKGEKAYATMRLVGCDIQFLIKHLESLFQPGMNWENCGRGGWHIDHIKPCIHFDLTKESEQLKCFHYTNLQPLWESENLKKGAKLQQ